MTCVLDGNRVKSGRWRGIAVKRPSEGTFPTIPEAAREYRLTLPFGLPNPDRNGIARHRARQQIDGRLSGRTAGQ